MGEPAIPTREQRVRTQQLAANIVDAVRNDEDSDIDQLLGSPLEARGRHNAFAIAQEAELLRAELVAARKAINVLREEPNLTAAAVSALAAYDAWDEDLGT